MWTSPEGLCVPPHFYTSWMAIFSAHETNRCYKHTVVWALVMESVCLYRNECGGCSWNCSLVGSCISFSGVRATQKYVSCVTWRIARKILLQKAPASSPWPQLCVPQPPCLQSCILFSFPLQTTLSNHTGPRPLPKKAFPTATRASAKPIWRQITFAALMSQLSSHIVPYTPLFLISTRPLSLPTETPASRIVTTCIQNVPCSMNSTIITVYSTKSYCWEKREFHLILETGWTVRFTGWQTDKQGRNGEMWHRYLTAYNTGIFTVTTVVHSPSREFAVFYSCFFSSAGNVIHPDCTFPRTKCTCCGTEDGAWKSQLTAHYYRLLQIPTVVTNRTPRTTYNKRYASDSEVTGSRRDGDGHHRTLPLAPHSLYLRLLIVQSLESEMTVRKWSHHVLVHLRYHSLLCL